MSSSQEYIYSNADLQQIDDNIDQIEENATKETYKILDPNNGEYLYAKNIIIEFIKEQKRIIYGGSAYHALIQHFRKDKDENKEQKERIYPEWERYDIEFYSPNPIRDLYMICNRLHDAQIKYVIGRQAQHDETFTVFANFMQYCDISYMPQNMFDKIKTIEINEMRYIHNDIMLIDIFRMFNDPLTSYWRLKKVYKRMKLLLSKVPFNIKTTKPKQIEKMIVHSDIVNYIMPYLLETTHNMLFTGEFAYTIYTNPDKEIDFSASNNITQLEIFTDEPDKVGKFIKSLTYKWSDSKKILERYNEDFSIKFYSRFFQFWDKRTVIYYKNVPLFTIIGTLGRCLPYIESELTIGKNKIKTKISSFLVTLNYYFVGYYYENINDQQFYFGNKEFMDSLITVRNEYLKTKGKTVIDTTIYKEFIISCLGKTQEFSREFLLRMAEKRANGIKGLMTYDPNISRGTYIDYTFEQTDGLELKESK